MSFIPIDPARTADNRFAVLAGHPVLAAAVPAGPPAAVALNSFEIESQTLSSEVAGSLGFGPFLKLGAGWKSQALVYGAYVYDEVLSDVSPAPPITGTRWGAGLRIIVRVSSKSLDTELSIGTVAAAVHLRQASAQYEVRGIGLGIGALAAIAPTLPSIGEFSLDAYKRIADITNGLQAYLVANVGALAPQPYKVLLRPQLVGDPKARTVSTAYALRYISKGRTRQQALDEAGTDLALDVLDELYERCAEDPPSQADRDWANDWIKAVRGLI